jgi:hypothetical protein
MAVQNDILSSTARARSKKALDNLFTTVPLLDHIKKAGGVEEINGGQRITRAAILAEHSNITQLSTGYESIAAGVADVLRSPEFEWCDFVAPIIITKKEELSNRGDDAVISIADARMKSVMGMLKREWEKQAIAGSSSVLTEMQTLNGFNAKLGWFEELTLAPRLTALAVFPRTPTRPRTGTTRSLRQVVPSTRTGLVKAR